MVRYVHCRIAFYCPSCARRIFDASADPTSRGQKNSANHLEIERYQRILCDQYLAVSLSSDGP